MRIDFHLHSRASFDCESDPVEIINWAVKKRLDGIFVTEHDTTNGFMEFTSAARKQNILALPGIEFTVARGTHYLVYLTPQLPLPQDDLSMIMEVHRRGGLVGLPHPYRSDTGLVFNQTVNHLYVQSEVEQILAAVDFIEVFNAKSLTWENEKARKFAERYPHLKQIAGSDSHFPSSVGAAHTEVVGLQEGGMVSLANQLKGLPLKIVTLPELRPSGAISGIQSATEGVRRLLVKAKPTVPKFIWKLGKRIYRTGTNHLREKSASKSIVEQD